MMLRHSWYLSPELASLALFSKLVTPNQKKMLMANKTSERGAHLLNNLPNAVEDLQVSTSFFEVLGISDILQVPVNDWEDNAQYQLACKLVANLPCVNDCAERGVALIETYNKSCLDESQKQWLMQVVESHRKNFGVNRKDLVLV